MSQSLCLICCHSFPAKRSRIVCDATRESFRKFCGDLGIRPPPEDKGGNEKPKNDKACGLDLPYGDGITVCGDCLSLVVLYVQRRTVQTGKEEKVRELQKAVCAALKDLEEVVEEVQGHIKDLQSTTRMGDESRLESFCKRSSSLLVDKENNPKAFRAKILKLNPAGFSKVNKAKTVPIVHKNGHSIRIHVKMEPREDKNDYSINDTVDDDGNFDDSSFPSYYDEGAVSDSDHGSSASSYSDSADRLKKRKIERPLKTKSPKKIKTGRACSTTDLSQEEASQWKEDLIGRIVVMQMNDDNNEDSDPVPNSFQYINGKLKLRGIVVNILEKRRALECTRCKRKLFEEIERDVAGEDVLLETLMRDHILSVHKDDDGTKNPTDSVEWEDVLPVPEEELERDWRKRNGKQNQTYSTAVYYCVYGRRCRSCPALLKKIAHDNGVVKFQRKYGHEDHRTSYFGLTPEQKKFATFLFHRDVSMKTAEALKYFRKKGIEEPKKSQLDPFLRKLRMDMSKELQKNFMTEPEGCKFRILKSS